MKVKIIQPIPGYAHFEGEVINLPDKVAKELLEQKKVEAIAKPDKK